MLILWCVFRRNELHQLVKKELDFWAKKVQFHFYRSYNVKNYNHSNRQKTDMMSIYRGMVKYWTPYA